MSPAKLAVLLGCSNIAGGCLEALESPSFKNTQNWTEQGRVKFLALSRRLD